MRVALNVAGVLPGTNLEAALDTKVSPSLL